jgi:hypothetical protein
MGETPALDADSEPGALQFDVPVWERRTSSPYSAGGGGVTLERRIRALDATRHELTAAGLSELPATVVTTGRPNRSRASSAAGSKG